MNKIIPNIKNIITFLMLLYILYLLLNSLLFIKLIFYKVGKDYNYDYNNYNESLLNYTHSLFFYL